MSRLTWIQTYTGRAFDFEQPDPTAFCLEDIAHALSQLCRFNGHTTRFYSVAEHSWLVAKRLREILPVEQRNNANLIRTALMHDAAEAYIGDVTTPLRRMLNSPDLQQVEQRVIAALAARFHLDTSEQTAALVLQADLDLLAIEQRDLMAPPPMSWGIQHPPVSTLVKVIGMSPAQARQTFLHSAQQFGVL